MGREQSGDTGYEWVNAWAATAMAETSAAMKGETPEAVAPKPDVAPKAAPITAPAPAFVIAAPEKSADSGQLMRDIAEIERARDALAAVPVGRFFARQRTRALTLVPSRTADSVPIVVGGVMALVMLTVFGAAAAMTKLAR